MRSHTLTRWLCLELVFVLFSMSYSLADFALKQVIYPSACAVATLAFADLNRDGTLDMVVAEAGQSTTINLYWGAGDGTFQAGPSYPAPFGVQSVKIVDLNLDGNPDIVTANGNFYPGIGSITVFLNQGDGTFAHAVRYRAGEEPHDIAIGDLNEDGIPDLTVAFGPYAGSAGVFILAGNGEGAFESKRSYGVKRWPQHIVLSDLNLDGHLDVVAAEVSRDLTIRLGNGDGTLQPSHLIRLGISSQFIGTMAAADYDGDGIPDLAVAFGVTGYTTGYFILRGIGDGSFTIDRHPLPGVFLTSLVSADLNNDGLPDLVLRDRRGVTPLLNLGNATFPQPRDVKSFGFNGPGGVDVADINGDGLIDIVETATLPSCRIGIALNTGSK